MLEITFQEFKTLPKKEFFIFFFTLENYGCGLCVQQENEYKKFSIPNLIKVKADTEEDLMQMDIRALPCTCLFNSDGTIKIKKYGVQYETQIGEMLK